MLIGGLEPAIAAFSELRRLQDLEFEPWADGVTSVITMLRDAGNEIDSPLLIGLAEALEEELIKASPDHVSENMDD